MSSNTVAQFAIELKMPANVLLDQLRAAGVILNSVEDNVTDGDKARLLESLRRSHGATEGKKITLTRRQTSEIRQADGSGRSRTIQVEVRKKRVFVKRDAPEAGDVSAAIPVEQERATQVEQNDLIAAPVKVNESAQVSTPVSVSADDIEKTQTYLPESTIVEDSAVSKSVSNASTLEQPALTIDAKTPPATPESSEAVKSERVASAVDAVLESTPPTTTVKDPGAEGSAVVQEHSSAPVEPESPQISAVESKDETPVVSAAADVPATSTPEDEIV